MQKQRRQFIKKSVIFAAGASVAVGATTLGASEKSFKADSNGVVVGSSSKKEIIYKKTQAWEDYYKQAK